MGEDWAAIIAIVIGAILALLLDEEYETKGGD